MKFKNYRRAPVRAVTNRGHVLLFKAGEEREIPDHLVELALANGLVPLEDTDTLAARDEQEAIAQAAEAEAEAEAEAKAAEEQAEAIEEAAALARSEAAKKAALTRARKAAEAKQQ